MFERTFAFFRFGEHALQRRQVRRLLALFLHAISLQQPVFFADSPTEPAKAGQ